MTQEKIDAISGQAVGLSLVLTTLIASLPPAVAMEMRVKLLGERIEQEMQDLEEPPSEAEKRSRYLILDGYLNLLEAVCKHG